MTIYVDKAVHKYGRMIMCHMISDNSDDELHCMAQLIGIQRKWFQEKSSFPHYDICKAKRTMAVKNGAIELSSRELIMIIKKVRNDQYSI